MENKNNRISINVDSDNCKVFVTEVTEAKITKKVLNLKEKINILLTKNEKEIIEARNDIEKINLIDNNCIIKKNFENNYPFLSDSAKTIGFIILLVQGNIEFVMDLINKGKEANRNPENEFYNWINECEILNENQKKVFQCLSLKLVGSLKFVYKYSGPLVFDSNQKGLDDVNDCIKKSLSYQRISTQEFVNNCLNFVSLNSPYVVCLKITPEIIARDTNSYYGALICILDQFFKELSTNHEIIDISFIKEE